MRPELETALRLSRAAAVATDTLPAVFAAEETLADLDEAEWAELQRRCQSAPEDGGLQLWRGLVLARRQQPQDAIDTWARAIEAGCTHWRVGWYIARAAHTLGQVELVDQACAAVLRAQPDFWFARELPKHARGYYAQLDQDRLIEQFFSLQPPRTRRFVEVGAFDGRHYSNVRRLHEQHAWTGLCIEPAHRNFHKLSASYAGTDVRCRQAAVGTTEGDLDLHVSHYPHLPDWGSDVATFHGEDRARWEREYGATWTVERVPVRSLSRLLDEAGIDYFDLLSIDTEGHDLEVIASLDFTRFRPQLIVIEYGAHRAAIRQRLHAAGYAVLQDNGQDLLAHALVERPRPGSAPAAPRLSSAALSHCLSKLNPHLLDLRTLPLEREVRLEVRDPRHLLSPDRFDLPAKHLYAWHRELGVASGWARELYHQHIRAFCGDACQEGDGRKHSIEDFYRAFDELLTEIKTRGFDPGRTLVPVGQPDLAIDGAHRLAACLLYGQPVWTLGFDHAPARFDSEFFRRRGLADKYLDALALHYCRLKPNTHVALVFPVATGRDAEIRALLEEHGRLIYAKEVALTPRGAFNLVREAYAGEPWLGDWRNGYAGAAGKAEPCFRGAGPLRVFFFEAPSPAHATAVKQRIRELFGLGQHSVHINDTHAETLRLAQVLCNANSIHFLNHAEPRPFAGFAGFIERYRAWLHQPGRESEFFCIDGSAVLAAYGLRDARDLDVLHFGEADFAEVAPDVNSHNADAHHHALSRDDILFHPDHHFYTLGLKFVALPVLRQLKARRDEGKDRADIALMDRLLDRPAEAGAAAAPVPRDPKVVALLAARNEAERLPFCLRALARHVDAIVCLDDCSDDDSPAVLAALAEECRIERILRKETWHRDEPGDRNALLQAGREIGGTHFVVLDADEAFTANCARDQYLRRLLLSLDPGDRLSLAWIQLWRSLRHYRFDRSPWTYASKAFAFADDRRCFYQSGFIHTPRVPDNLRGRHVSVVNYVHGVLHFQFADWPNLQIKQAWYRCLERLRQPGRSAAAINDQYAPAENEDGLQRREAPADWLEGYPDLERAVPSAPDRRRWREVLQWFREKDPRHFADLDIWRVDWAAGCEDPSLAQRIRAVSTSRREPAGSPGRPAPAPLSAEARELLAAAGQHFGRGDVQACRGFLERALHLAPNHPELLAALGNIFFLLGRFGDAQKQFVAALAGQPGQPRVLAQLAATYLRLGDAKEFVAAAERALQVDPACSDALRLLGDFQAEQGRHAEAIGLYRRLVAAAPTDAAAHALLGRSLAALRHEAEARAHLQRALGLDPKNTLAREHLARLQRRPGRPAATATR